MSIPYPANYNSSSWEHIFLSCSAGAVSEACIVWFKQWSKLPNFESERNNRVLECMPAFHALSNRTEADVSSFLVFLDNFQKTRSLQSANPSRTFGNALAMIGWEGIAMRCWTDPRAYAGCLQWIDQNSMSGFVGDLLFAPHIAHKLKESLDAYPVNFDYSWVEAACLRWAVLGKSRLDELPTKIQWACENNPLGDYSDDKKKNIKALIEKPLVWAQMLIQEQLVADIHCQTASLWLEWVRLLDNEKHSVLNANIKKYGNNAVFMQMLHREPVEVQIIEWGGLMNYVKNIVAQEGVPQSMVPLPAMDTDF